MVDGNYQKAARFDKKTENSKGELRATATGHLFRMNMRTHHMSCLGMANPEDGKKKAHDITVIKRSSADQLRDGAPKGAARSCSYGTAERVCRWTRPWVGPHVARSCWSGTAERSETATKRSGVPRRGVAAVAATNACIDYRHWHKLKHTYGIYFFTLEKTNSAAETCGINELDRRDPRNEVIVCGHLVGTSNAVMLRRIEYINPEAGAS